MITTMKYNINNVRYTSDVVIYKDPIYFKSKMQNIPLEEVYAKMQTKPQPITLRTKKLVDEFVVSDIHTDRSCEKETVLDNGRRAIMLGTRCASTFYGKLYKLNGPSVNPLERYVLFVGISRQNPMDNKQDENLAEETAAENAMVNPVMTIKLPTKIDEKTFSNFIQPLFDTLPEKFILTSKEIKKRKNEARKNEYQQLIDIAENRSVESFYENTLKPLMEMKQKYINSIED